MELFLEYARQNVAQYMLWALAAFFPLTIIFRRAGFPWFHAVLVLVPFFGGALAALRLTLGKWPARAATAGDQA